LLVFCLWTALVLVWHPESAILKLALASLLPLAFVALSVVTMADVKALLAALRPRLLLPHGPQAPGPDLR